MAQHRLEHTLRLPAWKEWNSHISRTQAESGERHTCSSTDCAGAARGASCVPHSEPKNTASSSVATRPTSKASIAVTSRRTRCGSVDVAAPARAACPRKRA